MQSSESLLSELNGSSREDLLLEVKRLGETNRDLCGYVDQLLAIVIERIPDVLERRA